ncbi:hypothetical protein EJ110_NYTH23017 [Nymphaea thermarum]|nr:hypothetical protein EJ110_NYTH23017 [Nymphaea thermarum]
MGLSRVDKSLASLNKRRLTQRLFPCRRMSSRFLQLMVTQWPASATPPDAHPQPRQGSSLFDCEVAGEVDDQPTVKGSARIAVKTTTASEINHAIETINSPL